MTIQQHIFPYPADKVITQQRDTDTKQKSKQENLKGKALAPDRTAGRHSIKCKYVFQLVPGRLARFMNMQIERCRLIRQLPAIQMINSVLSALHRALPGGTPARSSSDSLADMSTTPSGLELAKSELRSLQIAADLEQRLRRQPEPLPSPTLRLIMQLTRQPAG